MTKLAITTNPRTLWTLTMTLTNPHDALKAFARRFFLIYTELLCPETRTCSHFVINNNKDVISLPQSVTYNCQILSSRSHMIPEQQAYLPGEICV